MPPPGSRTAARPTVPNEPRADIVSASATYQAGAIVLSLQTAQPGQPDQRRHRGARASSPGSSTPPATGSSTSRSSGAPTPAACTPTSTTPATTPICAGQGQAVASVQDGSYVVTVNPKCIGNPGRFNWGGRTEFASGGANIMDRFPDGDGNYSAPSSKPAAPRRRRPPSPAAAARSPARPPPTTAPRPIVTVPVAANEGFWLLGKDGGVFSFGTAQFYGSIGHLAGAKPIVSMAADPDGTGYWFVGADGGIFAFRRPFWGSTGAIKLNKPIVGMAATPVRQGLLAGRLRRRHLRLRRRRVLRLDRRHRASTSRSSGWPPTPSGKGYWLVASDGGIFAFGDARFFGSTGDITLNQPIVGMAATPVRQGLLVRGHRRRHLRLRRRPVLRLGRQRQHRAGGRDVGHARAGPATGLPGPTGRSSPSATPPPVAVSTGSPRGCRSSRPSIAERRPELAQSKRAEPEGEAA